MPVIYNVTIKPTEKENDYTITWHNLETNTADSFISPAEVTPEETQRLWLLPMHQLIIGQKLFRFLDGDDHHFQQALDKANQQIESLQVNLRTCKQTADWPFELLAKDNTFLLPQGLHLVRTVLEKGKEKDVPPKNRPLKLLFMACSATDVQPELDFEGEEEAIFNITERLPIDMVVEDSGSLEGLRSQLEKDQYDAVLLSGHANIDQKGRPYFVMEDETGFKHEVFPDELWNVALIENPPQLLFLSGCRTGDSIDAVSFGRLLVEKYHVPMVLGWGRMVSDEQATHAGKILFHELGRGKSILDAVHRARFELIKDFTNSERPAWPLLRLFSSGTTLNAIVTKDQRWQPKPRHMKHVYLRNSQVHVLSEGFVGRRKQLQTCLRSLKRDYYKVGVVLLGTGGLGKSCLAGKICERFTDHTLIIVHGRFNAITLENALTDAFIVSQDEKGQQILSQKIEMADKLANLCASSFKEKNYLLLLDDFEQNMEGADKGQPGPLLLEAANLLNVLLHYLPFSGKMTQMIITSRYDFSLIEYDKDAVEERLERIWLTSFKRSEQYKKVRVLANILNYADRSIVPRLLEAGHGNPRLMEWMDILVGQMATAEVPKLLEAITDKREDFIKEHVIQELLQQSSKELAHFLRWFSIYRRSVFEEGAALIAKKTGLEDWEKYLRQGMELSLMEHDQYLNSYQVTPILREDLLRDVEDCQSCHEAAFAYYRKFCEDSDSFDPVLIEEWIFHALGCGEEELASRQGGRLIRYLWEHLALLESRRLGEWIISEKKQEYSSEHDAFLLNQFAATIDDLGDHHQAIEYFEQTMTILKKIFGDKHPNVASILNSLGIAWKALGEYKKAIDYTQQALSIDHEAYGEVHTNVARDLNSLGSLWASLGEYKKALDYYQHAMTIWKNVYGEEHQNVATTLNNLGLAFYSLGDHRKAIDYYHQALSIDLKVYGEWHPDVASDLNNLGMVWDSLGDHRKAIDYYQQALSIDRNVYGEAHPRVATRLNNLGSASQALGDHRKAIDHYQHALTIWMNRYGEKHPKVATALNNLGGAWDELGDHFKAIEYYKQALSIDHEVYGEENTNVARDLNSLGSVWASLGEYKKALDYYQQALIIWKKIYGEKHPNIASILNNLGGTWDALGGHRKSIEYFEQALLIDRSVFGERHPKVAKRLSNLGSAWSSLGDKKKAVQLFEQALAIDKEVYGKTHPEVAVDLNNLGLALKDMGKAKTAIKYLEQALSINRQVYGEQHHYIAATLNNLGEAIRRFGDTKRAIEYYMQALKIDRKIYGEKHPNVVIRLNNLGEAWEDIGDTQKAIDYYQNALAISVDLYGKVHPHVRIILNNLGKIWHKLGDAKKAVQYYEEVLSVDREIYGEKHSNVAIGFYNLGVAWSDIGDTKKTIKFYKKALNLFISLEMWQYIIDLINRLEKFYKTSHNEKELINIYEEVWEVLKNINQENAKIQSQTANLGYSFGNLLLKRGNWNDALSVFQIVKNKFKEVGDGKGVANVCRKLGDIYDLLNDYEAARWSYKDAIRIYGLSDEMYKGAITKANLGRLEIKTGLISDAVKHLKDALPYFKEKNDMNNFKLVDDLIKLSNRIKDS
jgi:tetratricopeptide (TPR) repeat protein